MSDDIIEVTCCEVCGEQDLPPVLDLGPMPIPDELIPVGSTRTNEKYSTEVLWCEECQTAQQHFVVPRARLFPPEYHYRGANTKDVLDGMEQLVSSVEKRLGSLSGLKVLDVGCNDGSLLDAFKRRGAVTTGIEPTNAAHEAAAKGHGVDNDYLGINEAYRYIKTYGVPDVITFVNVFAHIEDFGTLLAALSTLCGKETNPSLIPLRDTHIVIENHYMGSVLDRNQFDTFYHEHIRTYSFTSLEMVAHRLGMHISLCEFPSRYGGNIRVMMSPGPAPSGFRWDLQLSASEADFGRRLAELNDKVQVWRERKREQLLRLAPLPAAAMPGRAAILFNMLGLDYPDLVGVYEIPKSKKIGYYVPGTRIPILSDADFPAEFYHGPLLNMAWHIPDEIEKRYRGLGFKGEIIQAIDQSDFN